MAMFGQQPGDRRAVLVHIKYIIEHQPCLLLCPPCQADTSTVTIHDYSVRVEHLPEDTTEEELETFFERYGEVGALLLYLVNKY